MSEEDEESKALLSGRFSTTSTERTEDTAETDVHFTYRCDHFDMNEYAKFLGLAEGAELENLFTDFGVEQMSVYAREFAQR